jgi:transcriptional regulator
MYLPAHFEQNDLAVLQRLMRDRPLATLVTLGSGGLNANHIPLHWSAEPAPFGTLRGHVARANPLWSDLKSEVEALAVFLGPQAYVSPNWYPSKKQSGRVVPTWNYVAVHATGTLRIVQDARWLHALVNTLTSVHESTMPAPWQVSDAPEPYIATLIANVVGIEMVLTGLAGKVKASQNQPEPNRAGVDAALRAAGAEEAAAMAAWVRNPAGPAGPE